MTIHTRDDMWGNQATESFQIISDELGVDLHPSLEWNDHTARSFALDCALSSFNRRITVLSQAETKILSVRMNEARRLVRGERGSELEMILEELVMFVQDLATPQGRPVWLTSMNALLPSPYRAAVAACRSIVASESSRMGLAGPPVTQSLGERLAARLHQAHPQRSRREATRLPAGA